MLKNPPPKSLGLGDNFTELVEQGKELEPEKLDEKKEDVEDEEKSKEEEDPDKKGVPWFRKAVPAKKNMRNLNVHAYIEDEILNDDGKEEDKT